MKTVELEGALLDYWVARAHGMVVMERPVARGRPLTKFWGYEPGPGVHPGPRIAVEIFRPSIDWAHAGPIIESERIWLSDQTDMGEHYWEASTADGVDGVRRTALGQSPLLAAMRAYVASKYGEEVPDE